MEKPQSLTLPVALAVGMRAAVGVMLAIKSLDPEGKNVTSAHNWLDKITWAYLTQESWKCNPTMWPELQHQKYSINSTKGYLTTLKHQRIFSDVEWWKAVSAHLFICFFLYFFYSLIQQIFFDCVLSSRHWARCLDKIVNKRQMDPAFSKF